MSQEFGGDVEDLPGQEEEREDSGGQRSLEYIID